MGRSLHQNLGLAGCGTTANERVYSDRVAILRRAICLRSLRICSGRKACGSRSDQHTLP